MWKIDDFRPIYQKFLESGKTVRKFCSDEGIEECRFYHWQAKARKLREREPAKYYVRQIIRHKAIRKHNIDRSIEVATMPVLPVAKSYGGASVLANLMDVS